MKFAFFNDTGRTVSIHPATFNSGVTAEGLDFIAPLEKRVFELPEGSYPWVKMWDYKALGLSICVLPMPE